MVKYTCFDCGATIDHTELSEIVRCPYCGGRILIKNPPKTGRHVKAV